MGFKILLTGNGDTLSQELAGILHKNGAAFSLWPLNEKGVELGCDNPSLLAQIFRGVDALFLVQKFTPSMSEEMERIARAAKSAGVQFILRLSMWGASRSSPYLFQRLHGEADEALSRSGIKNCLLRPNIFMQRFVKPLGEELLRGALYLPQGEGKTSFVDERDVAEVAAMILFNPSRHHHRVYDLSGERAISNAEAVSLISYYARRRLAYVPVTQETALKVLQKSVPDSWRQDLTMSWHRAVRDMKMAGVSFSTQELVGHHPRSFEDFCQEVKWSRLFGPEPEPLL